MTVPASITPEVATWIRLQMTIAATRACEPVRRDLQRVDDWTNGVFAVLVDVLPFMLRRHPGWARQIGARWGEAAERFDQIEAGAKRPGEDDESAELLEARKMLFRLFDLAKLWPADEVRKAPVVSIKPRRQA